MEQISIDFIVDLPITNQSNIHILTIVDNFTKYIKVYAVKDRKAETAARCVYDFMLTFGIPLKLYSDRDPAYEAKLFSELMKLLQVKKLRTTGRVATRPGNPGNPGNVLEVTKIGPCPGNQRVFRICVLEI